MRGIYIQGATVILMIILLLLSTVLNPTSEETIKFFPLDPSVEFTSADTHLSLVEQTGNDQYLMKWETESQLSKPAYLRQDVSLLYMDGKLKGVKGLWKQEEQNIVLQLEFEESDSTHFEAVTFHYGGEIHNDKDNDIKSVQKMTSDSLYVVDSPHSLLESFRDPESKEQKEWKETLDHTKNQHLDYMWRNWIKEAAINTDNYYFVPLTSIVDYATKPLTGLTQDETDRVIGQLWEGLYKNYILPIANAEKITNHTMPLILIDKNNDHLSFCFAMIRIN